MPTQKWCYAGDWYVRTPDDKRLKLNTEDTADLVLGLWEYVYDLEQQLKKRQSRRRKVVAELGDE